MGPIIGGKGTQRQLDDFLSSVVGVQTHGSLPSGPLVPGPAQPTQPPLKFLHKTANLRKSTLDSVRKQSTDDLIKSLTPGSKEALRVKPDGTVMNGHHRLQVLKERGVDINQLPREIYLKTVSSRIRPKCESSWIGGARRFQFSRIPCSAGSPWFGWLF